MEDHEIRTQPLSDWKPETDIRRQKAFGKFVEEAGELAGIIAVHVCDTSDTVRKLLMQETADVLATISVIRTVCGFSVPKEQYDETLRLLYELGSLTRLTEPTCIGPISNALTIIGRCQVQGLDGLMPKGKTPNRDILYRALLTLEVSLDKMIKDFGLHRTVIDERKQAKIDTKLPWVMGTATDLLPEV